MLHCECWEWGKGHGAATTKIGWCEGCCHELEALAVVEALLVELGVSCWKLEILLEQLGLEGLRS